MACVSGIETISIGPPPLGPRVMEPPAAHDRAAMARRLRRNGWSYRRIAETMGIPYGDVGRLLEASTVPVAEMCEAAPTPAPVGEPPPAAAAAPAADPRFLLLKIDDLTRASETQAKALDQLSREVAEVRTEQRALGRRMQDLVMALWQRLTRSASPSPGHPSS